MGTKEIRAETSHTTQTIIRALHLFRSCLYRRGRVIAIYRSTAMMQRVSMLAVTHNTSTDVHNSQKVLSSCHSPVTTIVAPGGTTSTPIMRSAHASDMMKIFVVFCSWEVRVIAMMTRRLPTMIMVMMITMMNSTHNLNSCPSLPVRVALVGRMLVTLVGRVEFIRVSMFQNSEIKACNFLKLNIRNKQQT